METLVDEEQNSVVKSSVAAGTLADDCTSADETLAALDWENLVVGLQSSSEAFRSNVSGVHAYSQSGVLDGSLDFLNSSYGFAHCFARSSLPSTPTNSVQQHEELKYPDPLHQSRKIADKD